VPQVGVVLDDIIERWDRGEWLGRSLRESLDLIENGRHAHQEVHCIGQASRAWGAVDLVELELRLVGQDVADRPVHLVDVHTCPLLAVCVENWRVRLRRRTGRSAARSRLARERHDRQDDQENSVKTKPHGAEFTARCFRDGGS
jgi:hypothetical protein